MDPAVEKIVLKAQRLLDAGAREEARSGLMQAVRWKPQEALLWYWLGRALDEPARAVDALERALHLDPTLNEATAHLARLRGEPEPEIDLSWLGEQEEPAPPAAPAPASAPQATDWSFLEELAGGEEEREEAGTTIAPPEKGAEWSLLDELETFDESRAAPPHAPALSEDDLWRRAEAFIGPLVDSLDGMRGTVAAPRASDTSAAPAIPPVPPAPSPVALPRDEESPAPKAAPAKPKPRKERAPREPRAPRKVGTLGKVLLSLLGVAVVSGLLWLALRNAERLIPASVLADNPSLATAVVAAQLRAGPRPTPLPQPAWMDQAQAARYANEPEHAESILRTILDEEPTNVVALAAMSELLREQPGREAEALEMAQQAQEAVRTLPERALAAEAFAWAAAAQPSPDVGLIVASGEQAAAETPASPHAQWARAVGSVLNGEMAMAQEAASLATSLSQEVVPGETAAKRAALAGMMGQQEEMVKQYERALEGTDYVPWRVALVQGLRALGRPDEAQAHLDHLLQIAPDDPAVQGLQEGD